MIPFAPTVSRWTEDHYSIYTLVELAVGNRKELSPEELKDKEFADEIERMADSGESGWLEKIEEYMSNGEDLDDLVVGKDMIDEIERED